MKTGCKPKPKRLIRRSLFTIIGHDAGLFAYVDPMNGALTDAELGTILRAHGWRIPYA